ncbi:uncharacterized protein AB675_12124 [Cyphellophora attinorum]|uniref:YAP1-binding protein 2 n=1 Tax=Cyphellophora attinorum TaxID=1664694 RepID=A0A0N0NKV2_9EURO|nr:uncharacterized protein AB675_12124 [Phialophora attinorum]KPI38269.1 hypothetical protein AB675_12124 [Phialophora attinorum]
MATALLAQSDESPITAALPPNTDYITYLTILEYQLNPSNLALLNNVLKKDDGTLAKEIGWDLLRLVLPMLNEAPSEARECLELIAKQGNPREVVVRIAEELEKLGQSLDDVESDDSVSEEEGDDGLPTFAGEAPRVHLGQMKLDGMPEAEKMPSPQPDAMPERFQRHGSDDVLVFHALLSMLSVVHPRIKTQYPSRFLATSLPAALSAYRRMPITTGTTEIVLRCLNSLAGRQRPPVPLRPSATEQSQTQHGQAPLPDPEAPQEAQAGTNVASQSEKDIIKRLLQAVMLEALDEYVASLQGDGLASMLWTRRLRESAQRKTILTAPGKPTAIDIFTIPPFNNRDVLMRKFVSLSDVLEINAEAQIERILNPPSISAQDNDALETESEEPSEYPTSPSQIPFPTTGVVLMLAASQFARDAKTDSAIDLRAIAQLFNVTTPFSDSPKIPSPGIHDALHSLILRSITSQPSGISSLGSNPYIRILSILTQAFTITPDIQSRDDAHYLATKLLQIQPDSALRLTAIKQTLKCEAVTQLRPTGGLQTVPLATPFTEGALKAVGINWLKDDLLASLQGAAATADKVESSRQPLEAKILQEDDTLKALLFGSNIPSPPADDAKDDSAVSKILLALPYYIALLNFCTVLISRLPPSTGADLKPDAIALVEKLKPWWVYFIDILDRGKKASDEAEIEAEDIMTSASDIYAFEDAGLRLEGVLVPAAIEAALAAASDS